MYTQNVIIMFHAFYKNNFKIKNVFEYTEFVGFNSFFLDIQIHCLHLTQPEGIIKFEFLSF